MNPCDYHSCHQISEMNRKFVGLIFLNRQFKEFDKKKKKQNGCL